MLDKLLSNSYSHTPCSSLKIYCTQVIIAKGDSGASSHYLRSQDENILHNIQHHDGPEVTQPDGTNMNITGTGELPLHKKLSKKAKQGHILPNLTSSSLVALGPLCDDGCTLILTDKTLTAVKDNDVILRGLWNCLDGLWDIPLYPHTKCMDNVNLPPLHSGLYVPPHQRDRPPDTKIKDYIIDDPPSPTKNKKPKENFQIKLMRSKKVNRMVEQQL